MDNKLAELVRQLDVVVMYAKLDSPGHTIFPPILDGTAIVYIDEALTTMQRRTVLLHELGHVAKQRDERCLYDRAMSLKIKMEYGANRFMIDYLVKHYINMGEEIGRMNYLTFMNQNDIPSRDEELVKEAFEKYCFA